MTTSRRRAGNWRLSRCVPMLCWPTFNDRRGAARARVRRHLQPPSARVELVDALGEELEARGVAAADFGDAVAGVADVIERLHHVGPAGVAFAELDAEARAGAVLVALGAAVVLEV